MRNIDPDVSAGIRILSKSDRSSIDFKGISGKVDLERATFRSLGCKYFVDIAKAIENDRLQNAYSLSTRCENSLLRHEKSSFREPMLRVQYFVSAQILAAQGKLDSALERISMAERLARSELIQHDELENTTKGFMMEKSGRGDEAIQYYLSIAKPYALARLAVIYLERGQLTAAGEAADAVLKNEPTNATALIVLGVLLEQKKPSEALIQYRKAIASASKGNPSVTPLRYLELPRANAGVARLEPKP